MGSVQIWTGSAGSGKSTRVCQDIAARLQRAPFGPPLFWIVPSDASYAAEQTLMKDVRASLRAEVISLRRLAERLNQQLGCLPSTRLNATGRRLVLADVYSREFAQLRTLVRHNPSFGFFDAILAFFDEVEEYECDIESVMTFIAGGRAKHDLSAVDQRVYDKLHDLDLLYTEYCKQLVDRSLADSTFLLSLVRQRLSECVELQGTTIYIDGFSDLSPQELKFVVELAQVSGQMVFTLSMDPAWTDDVRSGIDAKEQAYAPNTLRLYSELSAAFSKAGIPVFVEEMKTAAVGRFQNAQDVAHLATHLFSATELRARPAADHIRIAAAQNPRVEADGVAREIARLVQSGQGTYGDFAVVVPHLQDYGPHLRASFDQHRIPNYLDEYPSFAHHPLAKFVLGAMELVECQFALDSVLRLLKCDLLPIRRDDADWFEAYLRKHEIRSVDIWLQPDAWHFSHDGRDARAEARVIDVEDDRADALRQKFCSVVRPFYDCVSQSSLQPRDFAEAVWQLLQTVGAKRLVAEWMVNEDAAESPVQASLHEQAWQKIVALLNDLTETLPDQSTSRQLLFNLVRDDVTQQSLSTIPAGIEEVLITDIERTRGWEADTVFLMGVSDGILPSKVHATGVIQDEERERVNHLQKARLGETTTDLQRAQRTSIYHAFTRAKQLLYLTYPLSGIDGKEMRPSSLLSRVRGLFQPGTVKEFLWLANAAESLEDSVENVTWTQQTAFDYVVKTFYRADAGQLKALEEPVFRALVMWLVQDDHGREQVKRAVAGLLHRTRAKSIGSERAKKLYGDPFQTHVYQLEAFAKCPFQQFVRYGLKVKADEGPGVSPAVRGTLIHDALLSFVETQLADVTRWRTFSDDDAVSAMRTAFEQVLASPQAAQWRRVAVRRQQAEEAFRTLRIAAIVLTGHARHGLFQPRAMELAFGGVQEHSLPAFEIPLDHDAKLCLGGRIDRVDSAYDETGHAFRIVDYKSSQMDLDLTRVSHGLQLQLPIYAAVVERFSEELFGQRSRPAGVIYIPLTTKVSVTDVPETEPAAKRTALKAMQSRGLMVNDLKLVSWMDERLPTGESTELFKQVYTKDGRLTVHAPVIDAEQWSSLTGRALQHAKEIAQQILDGDVQIAPYKIGAETPCNTCAYSSVCQFDGRRDTSLYRRIERVDKANVWSEWADYNAEVTP